jgi:pimeloyl-ACP methyl ester carboxylesterase
MVTWYLMVTDQEGPVSETGTPTTTHHQIDTNGTSLHVSTTGRGPAVVLLHGWPHTWQLWTSIIPALAATHRVIAPDLRGLGDSQRAGPVNRQQIAAATDAGRLHVPTMAVGARPVGDSLYRQLKPVADQLIGHLIEDCGHIIPLDRPDALLGLLIPFLS